jgi:hypothetical protein
MCHQGLLQAEFLHFITQFFCNCSVYPVSSFLMMTYRLQELFHFKKLPVFLYNLTLNEVRPVNNELTIRNAVSCDVKDVWLL